MSGRWARMAALLARHRQRRHGGSYRQSQGTHLQERASPESACHTRDSFFKYLNEIS